jgi:hypothetical protein
MKLHKIIFLENKSLKKNSTKRENAHTKEYRFTQRRLLRGRKGGNFASDFIQWKAGTFFGVGLHSSLLSRLTITFASFIHVVRWLFRLVSVIHIFLSKMRGMSRSAL